jgi:hypothetical protein
MPLSPYRPDHLCPPCGSEGARPAYHAEPVMIVFGSAPDWPCSGTAAPRGLGRHICNRCENCGHQWMESVPEGMDPASLE